ncbi:MAG: RsmD family RNA methyltransferase [Patescibacteria group bacterium]|nr:RsmD family RNA methyltransferase [Patescibacteria group bacterium]
MAGQAFFILGSHPALSLAEILACWPEAEVGAVSKQACVAAMPSGFDAAEAMRRLGGTVKIGAILEDITELDEEALVERLAAFLENGPVMRASFGISVYRLAEDAKLGAAGNRNLGMAVKKALKEAGRSCRWVKAQEGSTLSSVVVDKNHLIEEGAEFVLLADRGRLLLGRTVAVQPFEEFSRTDYGRPDRDTVQGMLPPKLARLMINLSAASRRSPVLDPFCGSGTVATEALRLGYPEAVASDSNPAAIEATQHNFEWLSRERLLPTGAKLEIFVADARNINNKLDPDSIGGVVTETYLGPPRRGKEMRGELQKRLAELSKLYYESLSAWRKPLKANAPVVLAVPIYVLGKERHGVDLSTAKNLGYEIEPLLPPRWAARFTDAVGKNRGLVYGRPDQLVLREIVRLRLKK